MFKRYDSDVNPQKMRVYQMYCTNLNYKKLNAIQIHQLRDNEELIETTWQVYDFKSNFNAEKGCVFVFKKNSQMEVYESFKEGS